MFRSPVEVRPGRMQHLARLPVFLGLKDRRVIIVGGSAAAAWKLELVAATGASIMAITADPSPEFLTVLAELPPARVKWMKRAWHGDDLAGACLAIGAIEDDLEATAFVAAAREHGVVVNVIDRPAFCDFSFGTIVNRSPLIIGISTDGAAPVFAQAIRARIEALLPRGLKAWAELAAQWRPALQKLGLSFQMRRRFWERFADLALSSGARPPQPHELGTIMEGIQSHQAGRVVLVGAGPGDPDLLTMKAMRALQGADVILHDDLVHPDVLALARREARLITVGKKGHGPSCKQTDINTMMVALACEGQVVVRLKSGDPLIFGRAQEEVLACRDAGIAVEIIPGVSAAQGAAARLSMSLTHRRQARRVQFITGHDDQGRLPDDLSIEALIDPVATTAIYMPLRTWPELAAKLMAAGLPLETPAIAVIDATRETERIVTATVATLAGALDDDATAGAILILFGAACHYAQRETAPDGMLIAAE